ncbi:hypothetical protein [Pseudacidovorax sp. RU35E]|jgi:hypothetical protein|uniref:hypothetical protein n=1 Tax=Pseudacidovorax sp. RU35E TaxID=1907403 RepID=UPI000956E850|nr:hypothetical protein [Pseudacidovorax sp. RU35E]SIQ69093.1 hypothetical protein SAMN05880557_10592 [Pseudacidovorax sp. RU35E]
MKLSTFESERQLAELLVVTLKKSISPDAMTHRRQVLSAARITRVLEQAFRLATESQKNVERGWLRRIVLIHKFRWGMVDAGYPKDFVDIAVEGLIVELNKVAKRPSGGN